MTPHVGLAIDVCLRALTNSGNLWLRKMMLIPFVPRKGDVIELWREDGATRKIELTAVYWSVKDSMFVEEQTDDTIHDMLEAEEAFDSIGYAAEYAGFGFTRLEITGL